MIPSMRESKRGGRRADGIGRRYGFPQLPQGYCKNGSGKHSLSGAIFNYIYWGADMLLHCFSNAVWTGWLSDSLHSNTRISPASKMVSPWGTSSWSCRLTETTSAPLGQGISWMVLPHTGAPKQTGDSIKSFSPLGGGVAPCFS